MVHVYPGEDAPIVALRNVELHVRAGEMLAVIGPSGSGKSTLLALLGGLLQPTAGAILVGEHDMARLDGRAAWRRLRATELALLLQDPLQNLLPYATAAGEHRVRPARRAAPPLAAALVAGRADRGVRAGPGRPAAGAPGLRRRAATGRDRQRDGHLAAGAAGRRADRPAGRAGRDAVIDNLRRAHELSGATVIIVTHDTTLAEALPRTLGISHGVVGSERRAGRRFAVAGRDGSVQLPPEIAARFPAGTVFAVTVEDDVVQLRPETGFRSRTGRAHRQRPTDGRRST